MKRKLLTFLLLISAGAFVWAQDETTRLLNLLDSVLSTATEMSKSVSSTSQSNPDNPVFNVRNKTGFTVKSVVINQTAAGGKGPITVNGNLYNGQSVRVALQTPLSEINRYNIRMVDEGGDSYSKPNVEITEFVTIEISIGDLD